MGYIVEISVNTYKHNNVTTLRKMLEKIAKNCKLYSTFHKIENNELYKRTHYFITMEFEIGKLNILTFIKLIKSMGGVNIELVYNDFTKTLLYGSKYYLNFITNTPGTIQYNRDKLRRSYSENDLDILKKFYIKINN
jgi:hypothetical protein